MEEIYKNYKIVSEGGFGMKVIKANGKGSIHLDLRGLYTNAGTAKRAIDVFLAGKKVTKDGEAE